MAADIGVYGLGTMGSALALNLAEKGFEVAVSNREIPWIANFIQKAGPFARNLSGHARLEDFVADLKPPRLLLFMIPSGAPLDAMITSISPLLDAGDTIIDAGNADFNDTRRRSKALAELGLHYVGLGVSGGEEGARTGPSMMFGGTAASWARLQPMAEAISAKFEGVPCVAHLGPDGAGHFVKTVHNGIEYADMQMIAEIYGILRDGAGWEAGRIGVEFDSWRDGPLQSFLLDATVQALRYVDPDSGTAMVDVILDKAGQKGTGRWTAIEALKLGQSASAIEAAVGARAWSSEKEARQSAERVLNTGEPVPVPESSDLEAALRAGRILAHAQGFRILQAASEEFEWDLDLATVAEIWRAGCIIRSALLDRISAAIRAGLPHGHLILSSQMVEELRKTLPALRRVVAHAALSGRAVPSLFAALAWHDSMAHGRGTANLIQAQRDVFGRHGFERVDRGGKFNADW